MKKIEDLKELLAWDVWYALQNAKYVVERGGRLCHLLTFGDVPKEILGVIKPGVYRDEEGLWYHISTDLNEEWLTLSIHICRAKWQVDLVVWLGDYKPQVEDLGGLIRHEMIRGMLYGYSPEAIDKFVRGISKQVYGDEEGDKLAQG